MKKDEERDEADFSGPEDQIEYEKRMHQENILREKENEYQNNQLNFDKYGFWELVVMTTLIVAFFPWSLLFCVLTLGMEETIYLYKAIISDLLVLVLALVLGVIGFCGVILLVIYSFQ
jgi:hypothetical protein